MTEPQTAGVEPGTRLRLLCIEDSPEDAELEAASLRRAGYEVHMDRVDNDADLKTTLAASAYDVIFLDHGLPGWDPRSALRAALGCAPQTPVVCVAGTIGEETAVDMLKLGASDYVLKDRMARLPAAVRAVLERAANRRARGEAEEALRASEVRYRRIVETAVEGIATTDADFRITYCNVRLARCSGTPSRIWWGARLPVSCLRRISAFVEGEQAIRRPARPRRISAASASPTADCFG